jgi:hypothetical protein
MLYNTVRDILHTTTKSNDDKIKELEDFISTFEVKCVRDEL